MLDLTQKNSKQPKSHLNGILYKMQSELYYQLDYFGSNPYHYQKGREYQKYDDIIRYKHNPAS